MQAGLTTEERDLIADAYDKGVIKVIAATCSLAAGINLPVRGLEPAADWNLYADHKAGTASHPTQCEDGARARGAFYAVSVYVFTGHEGSVLIMAGDKCAVERAGRAKMSWERLTSVAARVSRLRW